MQQIEIIESILCPAEKKLLNRQPSSTQLLPRRSYAERLCHADANGFSESSKCGNSSMTSKLELEAAR